MDAHDVIIIGAGVMGLSLALELQESGTRVLVLERGEPGREASWAAAGMLAVHDQRPEVRELASWSAELYPAFVRWIEEIGGEKANYSAAGALHVSPTAAPQYAQFALDSEQLASIEPALAGTAQYVYALEEASIEPRALLATLIAACKRSGVELRHEHEVLEVIARDGAATGVRTRSGEFSADAIVNCGGAWAGALAPAPPVVPVKGQMVAVLPRQKPCIHHVIRSDDIYMLPRADGRIVIGSTVERHSGFDKRVEPTVIQGLHQRAANLVPVLGEARIMEAWAGLRPGTPDDLPILGASILPGYFLATGHFRDGILLTPATAKLMAQLIRGAELDLDIARFSPSRFRP